MLLHVLGCSRQTTQRRCSVFKRQCCWCSKESRDVSASMCLLETMAQNLSNPHGKFLFFFFKFSSPKNSGYPTYSVHLTLDLVPTLRDAWSPWKVWSCMLLALCVCVCVCAHVYVCECMWSRTYRRDCLVKKAKRHWGCLVFLSLWYNDDNGERLPRFSLAELNQTHGPGTSLLGPVFVLGAEQGWWVQFSLSKIYMV